MKKEWVNPKVNVLGVSKTTDDIELIGGGHGWLPNGCHQNCGTYNTHHKHHPQCPNRPIEPGLGS